MRTLCDVARKRGLDALWGRVRRDNLPMLALFKRFGAQPVPSPDAGETDIDMRMNLVTPTPVVEPPARKRARTIVRLRKRSTR